MVSKSMGSRLSIVISGWPAVGKTTMAVELAKKFNLKLYSGGDILKMLAGLKDILHLGMIGGIPERQNGLWKKESQIHHLTIRWIRN